jgi:hypothetical protein
MARRDVPAALAAMSIAAALVACSDDGGPGPPPLFPEDYAATYQEVRNCRLSLEHNLVRMRVFAAPDAITAYTGRLAPFPTGAVILKEEHVDDGTPCNGKLKGFTVMQKLDVGSSPDTLDWSWQEVDAERRVLSIDVKRCTTCHTMCGKPPAGYDGTCTEP